MSLARRYLVVFPVIALSFGCRQAAPPQSPASTFMAYRFDDHLEKESVVTAPNVLSTARVTEPIVYKGWYRDSDLNWRLLRGEMAAFKGELVVRGKGGPAVIVAPKEPAVDWSLFESVRIRMAAQGGSEVKIKIGETELQRPLGPSGEYRVYQFNINITAPRGTRPLAIMPTDSNTAIAAIDFIELVPRKTVFPAPAGRIFLGKQDEYRNSIYVHSPSRISYEIPVPEGGRVNFGMGVTAKYQPVTFRLRAGPEQKVLFSRTIEDPDIWEDASVDLSAYAGRRTKLVFETDSPRQAAVGLWANPLLTTRHHKARPNILIYMVCTLRPDHTSLYGYSRDTTPFLRKFSAAGIVFDDAQSQGPWTRTSVPALMTSLYAYTERLQGELGAIPKGATTLAEQLRSMGYVTTSIITNPFVGRVSGLDRGFDYLMESPVVMRKHDEQVEGSTDSAAVNKVAMAWLEQHRHEPFFLYLHTSDPHAPYRPPKEFEARFVNRAGTGRPNREFWESYDKQQLTVGPVITREMCRARGMDADQFLQQAIDRYDGEVAFCDHSFEQLVTKLKQLEIVEDTLIVLVSDHGEEFWEHGFTAHGHSLYQELLHVVMLFWSPKLLPAPRRVAETVQLIDVGPTILELIGSRPNGLFQGVSLVPLLQGGSLTRKTPIMSSKFAHARAGPELLIPDNRTDAFAIWHDNWKMIYRVNAKTAGINEVELYDHHKDPAEKNNVAAKYPEVVDRFMTEIRQWIKTQDEIRKQLGPAGKVEVDQKSIDRLRSLGYLGGK